MKKAFIYMRKSKDKQQEMSIPAQRRHIHEYCENRGIQIINEYVDEAVSGSLNPEKRKGMKALMNAMQTTKFDYVIVFKIDRVSRKSKYFGYFETYVENNGGELLSTFDIENDDMYKMVYLMTADRELEMISQRSKAGKALLKKNGDFIGGHNPIGYETKIGTKKLFIFEKEAEIVKIIFNLRKQGKSFNKIADILDSLGYKNRVGNKFSKMTIKRILENEELYRGEKPYADAII